MKKLFTLLTLFLSISSGAWAIEQDTDGYYLIGSVQDWQNFAALVETTPTANAKMTADVDLGDDQTAIGAGSVPYQGSFDGQGHTLTVNYDKYVDSWAIAPFGQVKNASIQNLHVAGRIIQRKCGAGGVAGRIMGNLTIKKCWVSAYMYVYGSGDAQGTIGGIASYCDETGVNNSSVLIEDCIFSGQIATGIHSGSIMSHVNGYNGNSAIIRNCLAMGTYVSSSGSTGTFIRVGVQGSPYTLDNCYYRTSFGAVQGTYASDADFSDGTTATNLQNGRDEEVWVQDIFTNQPMLKVFANKMSYTVPASGIGTFSTGTAVTMPEGLRAYYCKDYYSTAGTIATKEITGAIPANTGVLLRGTAGETYTITASAETPEAISENALVAVTEATHVDQTNGEYTNFMMKGGKFIKIAASSDDEKMPANRAYLQLPTASIANSLNIEIDWKEETGIRLIPNPSLKSEGNIYYTLDGRKLNGIPAKGGVYINNGKKE